jgi:hypothetical protein
VTACAYNETATPASHGRQFGSYQFNDYAFIGTQQKLVPNSLVLTIEVS